MRARILRSDGSQEPLSLPEGGGGPRLDAMYQAIGCTAVDVVRLVEAGPGRPGIDMRFDAWGMFTKPANFPATALAAVLAAQPPCEYFCGDVILTGGADSEGDTLPLTAAQDAVLAEMIPRFAFLAAGMTDSHKEQRWLLR